MLPRLVCIRARTRQGNLFVNAREAPRLLRYEHADERAHWRMMRLHCLAGDRTGAVRQFERCQEALRDDLGIAPGDRVQMLYEQVRAELSKAGSGPSRRQEAMTSQAQH